MKDVAMETAEGATGRGIRWVPLLLVILPLWLALSGAFGLWWYFQREKQAERESAARFASSVSAVSLADDLQKIVQVVGERNLARPESAAALARVAAMVEGALGPANIGYSVERIRTEGDLPLLQVTLRSRKPAGEPLWLLTSLDSPPGSRGGEANASGLAATLAVAAAMAGDVLPRDVIFLFVPHANAAGSPWREAFAKARERTGLLPHAVLCVEAMGGEGELRISAGGVASLAHYRRFPQFAAGLEGGETSGMALGMDALGVPALRVASRRSPLPGEDDDAVPSAEAVAQSAGRLMELIRSLAVTDPSP